MEQYRVNVSSIQSFYQCRFRWWCTYVMNRVPIATSPALDAGKLLHTIFEDHFNGVSTLEQAASSRCAAFRELIPSAHLTAQTSALKAVQTIEDLTEAFPLWEDKYPITKALEVEEPFEYTDKVEPWILWMGRPDRVVVIQNGIYHEQNRGLAAGTNFGTYTRLQKRSYHEHLYGEYLMKKYCRPWVKKAPAKWTYRGTFFNLVRKLKFRTYVGKKNETTKTAAEMFYQQPIPLDMTGGLHQAVMLAARQHVTDMRECERRWREDGVIPAPNEKMNGGFSGNSEDPYFKLLIGEVTLDDNEVFKDREDMYASADFTTE